MLGLNEQYSSCMMEIDGAGVSHSMSPSCIVPSLCYCRKERFVLKSMFDWGFETWNVIMSEQDTLMKSTYNHVCFSDL